MAVRERKRGEERAERVKKRRLVRTRRSRARVWAREGPMFVPECVCVRERGRTRARDYVEEGKMRKPVSCDVGGTFMRRRTKQNRVHVAGVWFYDLWLIL